MTTDTVTAFNQLTLKKSVLKVLDDVGYETPTPIQAQTIPLLLDGKDVVGQAQTGTGKTAAFALPILTRLDLKQKDPQVMVLTPTRELAIQVAEAFQKYATHMKGFHVLPVYGGQDYRGQIRALQRGVHVVVGTPGRVMDHMRRGTLKLSELTTLVLDEADEMLRMGFIDDVQWILEQTPSERQIALFSATMPPQIRKIAAKHLNDPASVTIEVKTSTAETIRQRFWPVSGVHKLDALTRILEAENFDAMIVFVRTKTSTVELSEKLEARGYAAAPLNGDIPQTKRERTIKQLKDSKLDVLVATDVAARGLDVGRVSHIVNYDIPYDTEAYVHRIGRTGRAGRQGDAILFVAPRERRMLHAIENATRQKIEIMELPSTSVINDKRIDRFKQRISDTLANEDLAAFSPLIESYQQEHNVPALEIAAALAQMLQGEKPFLIQSKPGRKTNDNKEKSGKKPRDERERVPARAQRTESRDERERPSARATRTEPRNERERPPARAARTEPRDERERPPARAQRTESRDERKSPATKTRPSEPRKERAPLSRKPSQPEPGMERYRIEVGHSHDVKPGNIVGAIAGEAGLDSQYIGRVDIHDDYSLVDLPEGMPREIFKDLKKAWVSGQQLKISRLTKDRKSTAPGSREKDKSKNKDLKKKKDTKRKSGKKKTPGTATR